jgi:hypothetical protein
MLWRLCCPDIKTKCQGYLTLLPEANEPWRRSELRNNPTRANRNKAYPVQLTLLPEGGH